VETSRAIERPGWGHALRLWWSFSWRWPLLMLAALAPIAVIVALIKPAPGAILSLAHALAWPLALGAQIVAFRLLLRIDYRKFSVRALEREPQ